jgi:hypothetical protein
MPEKEPAEKAVRDIRRKTRRRFSAEEKIRIVIEGLRGEESIARGGLELAPIRMEWLSLTEKPFRSSGTPFLT